MRKVGVLVALAASVLAVALPGSGTAAATSQLSIETNAQWMGFGGIEVQLHVRCDGGFGGVNVQVSQGPPENTFPTQGFGGNQVFCDGQQHQVGVAVGNQGPPFDIGKAFAFATLCTPFGCPEATASKTINITF